MDQNEAIAKVYRQIKIALNDKLVAQGYQPVHEEHNDAVFNSCYIIWSNNQEALKLTWDGKEGWFILEITEDLPIHATTPWEEILVTPFNTQHCLEADIRSITEDFLNSLS